MKTTRTGTPPDPNLPLSRRLGELRSVLFGYAASLTERVLIRPPSYVTVGWETALDDLGARFGNVADILGEPALLEVEESTRRLLADIRHGGHLTCPTGPPIRFWRAAATSRAA